MAKGEVRREVAFSRPSGEPSVKRQVAKEQSERMDRQSSSERTRLEDLLEERAHLRIQMSLMRDFVNPDIPALAQLETRLFDLQKQIDRSRHAS